jgi:vacuolar-type H+-ATPase subunit F/Vma7
MSRIAAIGEAERLRGFAFAGVQVVAVDHPEAARTAWRGLAEDVGLVILTPTAHAALEDERLDQRHERLWVVLPA